MIPYISYRENDSEGRLCYYLLQKAFPHYVSILSVGRLEETLVSAPVAGYNLYINFNGCLRGRFIPSYRDAIPEIQLVMNDMAIWFYNNRILADQKKYAKFKII